MALPGQTSYTGTPNPTNPEAVQGLYPNWLLNQIGSQYAAQYGYADTSILAPVIHNMIIDSIPAQYNLLKLVFDKPPIQVNDEEHFWFERGIPRPLLTSLAQVSTGATVVITLTAGGTANVSQNTEIIFENERHGIVTTVDTTLNRITVKPQNGEPVFTTEGTAGEKMIIGFNPIADGQNFIAGADRMNLMKYTNFIARGQRSKRWTTMTAQKYKNNQQVDYFEKDAKELMENVWNDVFYLYMNANKGEYDIQAPAGTGLTAGTYKAKVGDGIFPFLQKNGAAHATSSPATFETDFKTLAFSTNFKEVDGVRYVIGTPRMLNLMSDIWKDPIRYAPTDRIASMDLVEYRFGEMRYVPISVVHFDSRYNQFQSAWAKRLLVLDPANIETTVVKGFQQTNAFNTGNMSKINGGYNDYIDYVVDYMLGTRVTTVEGHFWMDMIGV